MKKPGAGSKGKKKPALMNLNDDEEEDGDEEMVAREAKCMEQLERALSKCQKCGDEKCCKIDKLGNHHQLTFQQRRSWAVALVCGLACYANLIERSSGFWNSRRHTFDTSERRPFPHVPWSIAQLCVLVSKHKLF